MAGVDRGGGCGDLALTAGSPAVSVPPPVIRGKIADGYTGRVVYRTDTFSYDGLRRQVFPGILTFMDRKLIEQLAHPRSGRDAIAFSGEVDFRFTEENASNQRI